MGRRNAMHKALAPSKQYISGTVPLLVMVEEMTSLANALTAVKKATIALIAQSQRCAGSAERR